MMKSLRIEAICCDAIALDGHRRIGCAAACSSDRFRIQMAKILRCQDVGMKCDFVARGETEQEVLKKATEHAGATHNMKSIPPEMLAKVRAAVRDE